MRKLLLVLYTAFALGANAAAGQDAASLRQGDMQKLAIHEVPVDLPDAGLFTMDDTPAALADFSGQWVLVNFWATWCAPCRAEMPGLDRLQAAMPALKVLPVASGRNDPEGIARFWADAGITNLTTLRDPKGALSKQMGIMGLPVTVLLNPQGQEVARLIGDAAWDSPNAQAVLAALMAP